MIEEIERLIASYNTKADELNNSIEVVETLDLYADQRKEWRWYLKGQQQVLRNAALDLQVILLKKQIESS